MTAFVINTGGTEYFDAKTGGSVNATLDTYTISANTTFVVRTDTYACANHTIAFGSLDTVAWSGTGGTLRFDPTYVRVIAYTGGSGNSPAYGTTITANNGTTGVFLGCWTNWQSDPIVAGAAIGATGYMKLGGVSTPGNFNAGALTGITATCSGADVQGWIEIKSPDAATITMSNIAKVESVEAWFELGTTNGARGQIIPCPTTATVAGVWPGVWIETSAGSGVYEQYHGMGSMVALATFATDARNKVIWQTTGGIRIGNDGTNGVGYLPPTGCKVRIPATILTNCTRTASGSGPRVLPNATIATRQEFITTNAGTVDLKTCVIQWYMNMAQAFLVKYKSCAINDSMIFTEIASPLDVDDCIVAPTQAQLNFALNITSCFGGGTIKNSRFARFSLAASGAYAVQTNYVTGVTFQNNVIHSLGLATRGNATTGAWTCTKTVNCVWNNNWTIGGRIIHNQCINPSYTVGFRYTDTVISTATTTTNPMVLVEYSPGTSSVVFDGSTCPVSFPISIQQPYTALFGVTGALGVEIKNIGTKASPLVCNAGGSATGVIVQGGGNSASVRLKRCYVTGLRTGPVAGVNSDSDWVIENANVTGYGGTGVTAILNATIKGCRYIGATTGQTSVYGTHWRDVFTAATTGSVWLEMNEPTAASVAQCAKTGGTPQFSSLGTLLLTKSGDQVTWEMPYYCKGHTAFATTAVGVTGTNATFTSGSTYGNHTLEFQIDLNNGAGFNGTWTGLNATNLRTFTISPSLGFKLKIRATTLTVSATNSLTNIRIYTESTDAAQDNYYPVSVAPISVSGLVTGSRVKITKVSDGTVLFNGAETAGAISYADNEFTGAVNITARKGTSSPTYKEWVTQLTPVSNITTSATALQERDDQ
jgi:hypothetical protein